MRILLLLVLCFLSLHLIAAEVPKKIVVSESQLDHSTVPFIERPVTLALNFPYPEIISLREEIAGTLDLNPLQFFTGWEKDGEAHVTVITPPEYNRIKRHISLREINQIALENEIQEADLKIVGIGSGKKQFEDGIGETFIFIVRSKRLLDIRREVARRFLQRGGNRNDFRPDHYFPHITIGYTHADIHEPEIYKDERTLDKRFQLLITL